MSRTSAIDTQRKLAEIRKKSADASHQAELDAFMAELMKAGEDDIDATLQDLRLYWHDGEFGREEIRKACMARLRQLAERR